LEGNEKPRIDKNSREANARGGAELN